MAKPVTSEDVDAFLAKIKAADTDKKVDIVQLFGLSLEDASELPAHSTDALTLLFPSLLRSTSHLLPLATLTSLLPFYIPLLPANTPHALRLALHQLLPPLLEKINDAKEKIHQAAAESLAVLGKASYAADIATSKSKDKESLSAAWERGVKDGVLGGKGWRGKVEALKMLQKMRVDSQSGLPLKPWLPSLVDLLEDGDQHVREQAKETTIALLAPTTTPAAARSELKKLLAARNVRKTITDAVINGVFNGPPAASLPTTPAETPRMQTPVETTASTEDIETVYVASARDVETEFAKMLQHMEGKETEQNWLPREQSAIRVRGMLRGGAFQQHPEAFVHGLRSGFMEGLVKILMSLRTTVAQCGCALVLDLTEQLKTAFDPCVESILPTLGKMAGFTKRIIADKSQKDVTAIIVHTSANARLILPFILNGLSEKNVQTRQYFAGHLKTFLDVHSTRSKHAIENSHTGALDHIETALRKALADVNPTVKDLARAAFWSFESTWPQQGRGILDSLDGMALKALEKANPKGVESSSSPKRPTVAPRRGTSSVAAAIAAQRKAKAAALAAERAQAATEEVLEEEKIVSPSAASAGSAVLEIPAAQPARTQQSAVSPTPAKATRPLIGTRSREASPSSSRVSPTPANGASARSSPMARQHSSTTSSSASGLGQQNLQTPEPTKTPLKPRSSLLGQTVGQPIGLDDDDDMELLSWNKTLTPSRPSPAAPANLAPPVEEALKSQADQAVSAARQLLDFDDSQNGLAPSTPVRPANGRLSALRTPKPALRSRTFQDSPRPGSLTPAQLHRIQERVKSRRWWIRSRIIPDTIGIPSVEEVNVTISSVTSGNVDIAGLLSLRRFAFEHSLTPSGESTVLSPSPLVNSSSAQQASREVWGSANLFDRLLGSVLDFLDAKKSKDVLEAAVELLCDLVHNQWELLEDRDMAVSEATLVVRASGDAKVNDPTDAIMEYMARSSDPVYFAGTVLAALDRYLLANQSSAARLSGFVLGLTALGRLVMRLPKEVAEDEVERFAAILYKAFNEASALVHESAMNLILSLQSSLRDKETLFKLLPELKQETRSLAMYYMSRLKLDDEAPVSVDDLEEEMGKLEIEKRMNHLESRAGKVTEET